MPAPTPPGSRSSVTLVAVLLGSAVVGALYAAAALAHAAGYGAHLGAPAVRLVGSGLVVVRCAGAVPSLFAPLGDLLPLSATGRSVAETP